MADEAGNDTAAVPLVQVVETCRAETAGAYARFAEKCAAIKELLNQLEAGVDSSKDAPWTVNEVKGMQQELSRREQRIAALETAIQELQKEPESLREELNRCQQEKEAMARELENAREQQEILKSRADTLARMESELEEVRKSLPAREETITRLEAELGTSRDALKVREENISGLESELGAARQEVERLSRAVHDTVSLRQQLDQAVYERDALQQEVQRFTKELEARQSRLETCSTETIPVKSVDEVLAAAHDEQGRRRRMGEMLVEAGILSPEQLKEMLMEQAGHPARRLGKLVVDRGYTSESVIARILAAQLRLPFSELREGEVDASVPPLIGKSMATLRHCVPIRREGGRILLAMANPLDLIAMEDVERALQCPVDPVVATSGSIDFTIARYGAR